MSFVQLQKVLPTPAVSFLSALEETLSFLPPVGLELLVAPSKYCIGFPIRIWIRIGLDWITDTFVVTCCQMSAERK